MPWFRTRGHKLAIAATVLGSAMLLAAGYLALPDDSLETPRGEAPSVSLPAPDPGTGEVPDDVDNPFDPGSGNQFGFGTNGVDPFDNVTGSHQTYDVEINLRTDGRIKFIYRFRDGSTDPKTANGSTSISKQIPGPRAVAQTFVQLIGGSYVTCSISIDGETVSTSTTKKMYDVVACTG